MHIVVVAHKNGKSADDSEIVYFGSDKSKVSELDIPEGFKSLEVYNLFAPIKRRFSTAAPEVEPPEEDLNLESEDSDEVVKEVKKEKKSKK